MAGPSARSAVSRGRDSALLNRTAPSDPTAQNRKLPFARSIASMLIFVVIDTLSTRSCGTVSAYVMPLGSVGGIHRISSIGSSLVSQTRKSPSQWTGKRQTSQLRRWASDDRTASQMV